MIAKILKSYVGRSNLSRLPFLLGFVLLTGAGSILIWIVRDVWIDKSIDDASYLLSRIVIQTVLAIAMIPLCIAKLRDLGWPILLSGLAIVPPLGDPKIFVWLAIKNGGTFPMPLPYLYVTALIQVIFLVLLLLLFFRSGLADGDT